MGGELGVLSLNQLQELVRSHWQFQPLFMWKDKQVVAMNTTTNGDENCTDDSWEVRAFEEDTAAGNLMGCTWPPRSYTCTYCQKEFRSAQALGGHMNVHRRDRARLHQNPTTSVANNRNAPSSPTLLIPTQELITNGLGLCPLLYPMPNPNNFSTSGTINSRIDSLLVTNDFISTSYMPSNSFPSPITPPSCVNNNNSSSLGHSGTTEPSTSNISNGSNQHFNNNDQDSSSAVDEEIDLELRLGRRRSPTPP